MSTGTKLLVFAALVMGGVYAAWRFGALPSDVAESYSFADEATALERLPPEIYAFVVQNESRALHEAYATADREVVALRSVVMKAKPGAERNMQIERLLEAGRTRLEAAKEIADSYVRAHGASISNVQDSGAARPVPVSFESSDRIDFYDIAGHAHLWYARKKTGDGFDLFRGSMDGMFKTDDGRLIHLAETRTIQREIAAWVDGERDQREALGRERKRWMDDERDRRETAERERMRRRYVSREWWTATGRIDIAVCVRREIGAGGAPLVADEAKALGRAAAKGCAAGGRSATIGMVSDAFGLNEGGVFDAFFSGIPGAFAGMLGLPCDELLMIKCESVRLNKGGSYGEVSCKAVLEVVRARLSDGHISEKFSLDAAVGPDIRSDSAARKAVFNILENLLEKRTGATR